MIRQRITICTIVVFYFFATLGGFGGIVFCLGADGHVAIELAQAGMCDDILPDDITANPHASQINKNKDNSTEAHCGPCNDIRILPNSLSRHSCPLSSKLYQQESKSPHALAIVTYTPPATEREYNSALSPVANSSLISLQSVILLI